MKIIKRDGREVPYDCEKIRAAISAANDEMKSDAKISDTVIGFVTGQVEKRCHALARPVHVEEVQDMVLDCRFVNDVLHIRESEKHLFRRAPVERTHREIVVFTLVNG